MARSRLGFVIAAAAVVAVPWPLVAQGFQVNEHGTCVMGRAGVGVAKPCGDGSEVFYNPAGLAGMSGVTISVGVTGVYAYGSFTDDLTGASWDLDNSVIPVPHLYAAAGVTPKLTAALGVFVPYGLGTEWPLDTTVSAVDLRASDAFPGRFNGYDSELRSIYVQPTLAYQINEMVSIGAGFDFVIGSINLDQRLDFSEQVADEATGTTFGMLGIPFHTDFANGHLTASGATGFGGHVGVLFQPIPRLSIGARYMSRVKLDYDGSAEFTQVPTGIVLPPFNPISINAGLDPTQPLPLDNVIAAANLFSDGRPLGDQTATASITMPDQITAGLAFDVTPSLALMADWQWVHWATFEELVAALSGGDTLALEENYRNTNAFRFGFEWAAVPGSGCATPIDQLETMTGAAPTGGGCRSMLVIRGGYLKHQAAAPDETVTPLLPEGPRNEFTGGIGLNLSERFSVNLAYQFIRQDKRRGRVREPLPGTSPTVALNSGLYTFNAHLGAATFTVRF